MQNSSWRMGKKAPSRRLRACFESRQRLSLRGAKGDEALSQSWKN
jgi:hypothetical protein